MANSANRCKFKSVIDDIGVTSDTLTSRGGLSFFARYLRNTGVVFHLESLFGSVRKSSKGRPVGDIFKQIFCFFLDGTSRHLIHFDRLKEDQGYALGIETNVKGMVSSHGVKRFFNALSLFPTASFRKLLRELFLWRLKVSQPDHIVLGLDTMVMDNDEARVRHGVQPTYKKVCGFQPLQLTWSRFTVDAILRGGKKHGNHGETAISMVKQAVALIRKRYREDVPIVVNMDSGFFDQKFFEALEDLEAGYTCSGKIYDDIRRYVDSVERSFWGRYENGHQAWDYLEFGDIRGNWRKFRRAFFTRAVYEEGPPQEAMALQEQGVLDFARTERVIYTNLGMGGEIDQRIKHAGLSHWLTPHGVIELAHGRGRDELVHRALKDFGHEQLPFKLFQTNNAYYYCMLMAFFLYEAFKEDVCKEVVPLTAYATTLRRKVIDIAAKIVRTGGKTILKVTRATWEHINIEQLWRRSGNPPPYAQA